MCCIMSAALRSQQCVFGAVLALARIMCADNVVLLLRFESLLAPSSIVCDSHVLQTLHIIFSLRGIALAHNLCLDRTIAITVDT